MIRVGRDDWLCACQTTNTASDVMSASSPKRRSSVICRNVLPGPLDFGLRSVPNTPHTHLAPRQFKESRLNSTSKLLSMVLWNFCFVFVRLNIHQKGNLLLLSIRGSQKIKKINIFGLESVVCLWCQNNVSHSIWY